MRKRGNNLLRGRGRERKNRGNNPLKKKKKSQGKTPSSHKKDYLEGSSSQKGGGKTMQKKVLKAGKPYY